MGDEADMEAPVKHDIDIHSTMGSRWEFNAAVTDVFDEMLERSIPQYSMMRDLVTDLAAAFRTPGTEIVDLGSSRGETLAPLIRKFGASNSYVAVEVSQPMLKAFRERFANWIDNSVIRLLDLDLRTSFPECRASVVTAILTLVFVPINYRQRIVADAYNHLLPGGAFLLVEKVLGAGLLNEVMVDRYHRMKADNGYTQEEITRKALALEGVQVPLTASWIEGMLTSAGFRTVDVFWRWMNFCGWIAIK
jgi:tRNA (cmo5U34)-methyltransferase